MENLERKAKENADTIDKLGGAYKDFINAKNRGEDKIHLALAVEKENNKTNINVKMSFFFILKREFQLILFQFSRK